MKTLFNKITTLASYLIVLTTLLSILAIKMPFLTIPAGMGIIILSTPLALIFFIIKAVEIALLIIASIGIGLLGILIPLMILQYILKDIIGNR